MNDNVKFLKVLGTVMFTVFVVLGGLYFLIALLYHGKILNAIVLVAFIIGYFVAMDDLDSRKSAERKRRDRRS